jgi:hypothetical protein
VRVSEADHSKPPADQEHLLLMRLLQLLTQNPDWVGLGSDVATSASPNCKQSCDLASLHDHAIIKPFFHFQYYIFNIIMVGKLYFTFVYSFFIYFQDKNDYFTQ